MKKTYEANHGIFIDKYLIKAPRDSDCYAVSN